ETTIEHFPELKEFGLANIGGKTVLINRSSDEKYQIFDQLVFHNGPGATLEMRVYSEADVRARLEEAGLTRIQLDAQPNPEYGVVFSGPCSLPIVASRQPFCLGATGVTELVEQLTARRRILGMVRQSRWVRLGRLAGIGPDVDSA